MQPNNLSKIQSKQIRVLYLTTLVLLLPIFAGLYFLYTEDDTSQEALIEPEVLNQEPISLDAVQTTAHSALVVSLNTNTVLYQKNPNKPLPLASLTKLVTAQVAQTQSADPFVSISKMEEMPQYGDSKLTQDSKWSKEELIGYTLVTSSNDGAHSLKEASSNPFSFIQNMNSLAATIGLQDTRFYNETGLDDDEKGILGSKGTAQDISKILSYVIKNNLSVFEKTQHDVITVSTPEGSQLASNTNEITNQIPGLLVSKTGYTDLAGGNLAVVADMGLNEPIAFIVLKSSRESRFDDVLKLQEEYFEQVRMKMR